MGRINGLEDPFPMESLLPRKDQKIIPSILLRNEKPFYGKPIQLTILPSTSQDKHLAQSFVIPFVFSIEWAWSFPFSVFLPIIIQRFPTLRVCPFFSSLLCHSQKPATALMMWSCEYLDLIVLSLTTTVNVIVADH